MSDLLSRDVWSEFCRRCDERHARITMQLDEVLACVRPQAKRVERLARAVWWQRVILVLVVVVVSFHPVVSALPALGPLIRRVGP